LFYEKYAVRQIARSIIFVGSAMSNKATSARPFWRGRNLSKILVEVLLAMIDQESGGNCVPR